MSTNTIRPYINLIAVLLTIGVNGLANTLPLNGQTTGEISDRFAVYFVPAGYVFAIWGVIYLGWIAFAIYQLLPAQRDNPRWGQIGYWFALSSAANIAWLFLWHYEYFVLTVVAMLTLLFSLIMIYSRAQINQLAVGWAEKWCVDIPFSIYLGWVSVATIANITTTLEYLQWSGWGVSGPMWAVIMLATAVLLAAAISLTRGDIPFLLVLIWSFIGIALKQADTPLVANSAWIATAVVVILLIAGQQITTWRINPTPQTTAEPT